RSLKTVLARPGPIRRQRFLIARSEISRGYTKLSRRKRPKGQMCGQEGHRDRDGDVVRRFGFHVLGRHSIATFLMDNQENPSVVQAVMRHSKMDMTLYYSHSHRAAKRAAQERVLQHLVPAEMRVQMRAPKTIQ